MTKGVSFCKEGLGLLSLVKRRLMKDLISVHKHLKEGFKMLGDRLFFLMPSDRARDNGHKLKHRVFYRKHFFTVRAMEH